ncbi:hypothetical protein VNI00_017388 [Paramarasmius palmivorus]|uniref:F-box domain-containing protein n=1 Tax=Paramarasmius palmivorus TaxID=297713 RepID=A0AAW0B9B4_9AGAR
MELLRTGQLVAATELAHYKQLILSAHDYAEILRAKIENLQQSLTRVEYDITEYQSLFSPIRKIPPPEVLSHIFLLSKNTSVFTTSSLHRKPSTPAFLLVCVHWRRVALSSPEIWADISLLLDPMGTYSPSTIKNLESHVERSKAAKLHVKIECQQYSVPNEMLSSFQLPGLRHIDFHIPETYYLYLVIEMLKGRMETPGSRFGSAIIRLDEEDEIESYLDDFRALRSKGLVLKLWVTVWSETMPVIGLNSDEEYRYETEESDSETEDD